MTPRFFSFHYSNAYARSLPPREGVGGWQSDMQMQDQMPSTTLFDTIKQTVLRMNGKVSVIQTPADLSKAIAEIDRGGK